MYYGKSLVLNGHSVHEIVSRTKATVTPLKKQSLDIPSKKKTVNSARILIYTFGQVSTMHFYSVQNQRKLFSRLARLKNLCINLTSIKSILVFNKFLAAKVDCFLTLFVLLL